MRDTNHGLATMERLPRKLFVDLLNRSTNGVAFKTKQKIDPGKAFHLCAFNTAEKSWELFKGKAIWIKQDSETSGYNQLGAELQPADQRAQLLGDEEGHDKKMPLASDYRFFRRTELLKSISRDAVCPLLNCVTFKHVKAGQRFISQGEFGDCVYVIQCGICVVNLEKDGELNPVARLHEGDIVGEMAILTEEPRSSHVDAETDMHLWKLTKVQFDSISEEFPELRCFLTDVLARWFETRTVTAERRIGKYLITDIIGKGGYSIVYRGVHEALNMPVAIKMLKHDTAMNPDFYEKFGEEAKTIARLNHENIVKVHDIVEVYRTIFIVSKHLHGMPLDHILKRMSRLPLPRALDILIQVCTGLAYAHNQGILHQDIKPGNIFVQPNDKVKIVDFGLACCPGHVDNLCWPGTIFYTSPEYIKGDPVDEQSDIYSLGITAYEMVTGQRPFLEDGCAKAMHFHLNEDVPDPAEIVPDLPTALCDFIIKACRRDPAERYQNVAQALEELHHLAKRFGLTDKDLFTEKRRMATFFLFYKDEHQQALDRLMEDFRTMVRKLGIELKATELKDL
jgi:tRNA A-37 threonylcarbamoyl transferase component Bud32